MLHNRDYVNLRNYFKYNLIPYFRFSCIIFNSFHLLIECLNWYLSRLHWQNFTHFFLKTKLFQSCYILISKCRQTELECWMLENTTLVFTLFCFTILQCIYKFKYNTIVKINCPKNRWEDNVFQFLFLSIWSKTTI